MSRGPYYFLSLLYHVKIWLSQFVVRFHILLVLLFYADQFSTLTLKKIPRKLIVNGTNSSLWHGSLVQFLPQLRTFLEYRGPGDLIIPYVPLPLPHTGRKWVCRFHCFQNSKFWPWSLAVPKLIYILLKLADFLAIFAKKNFTENLNVLLPSVPPHQVSIQVDTNKIIQFLRVTRVEAKK